MDNGLAGGGAGGNSDLAVDTGVTLVSTGYNSNGDGYCRVIFPPMTPSMRARARKRVLDVAAQARQATANGLRRAATMRY